MRKGYITLIAIFIACLCFGQEVEEKTENKVSTSKLKSYTDLSFQTIFFNNTKDIDNYFSKTFEDYNRCVIPNIGIGLSHGSIFSKRFAYEIAYGISYGKSFSDRDKSKTQNKSMVSSTISIVFEYFFLETKEAGNLSLKTGFGYDYTTFRYNRKIEVLNEPVPQQLSYSWGNSFVPIRLTWSIYDKNKTKGMGVFIQYNIRVIKGKTTYTGLDIYANDVPCVSQNNLAIGLNFRL